MSRASLTLRSASVATCLTALALPAQAFSPPAYPSVAPRHIAIPAAYNPLVAQIQAALNSNGYDAGPADGMMGSHTSSAIEAYQRDKGLLVTGEATPQLLNRLQSGGPQARQAPAQGSRDVTELRRIQRRLSRLGYDVQATGRMDRDTHRAIRDFQRDQGLAVTGETSPDLMHQLHRTLQARGDTENGPATATRGQIRSVQEALNARGYDAGPPDGVVNPSTRQAIRKYRRDAGLPTTTEITPRLLANLGIENAAGHERDHEGANDGQHAAAGRATYRERIADNFADGDFRSWNVLQGNFEVRGGVLRSTVAPPASNGNFGRQVINGIVNSTLGISLGGGNAAGIEQPTPFANAFNIDARLAGAPGNDARLSFGPYRGNNADSGYRLVYDASSPKPYTLVAVTGDGTRTLASSAQGPKLNDGRTHHVEWTREPDGQMTLAIDGDQLFDLRDRTFDGSFSGLSMINGGGSWGLDEVKVGSRIG